LPDGPIAIVKIARHHVKNSKGAQINGSEKLLNALTWVDWRHDGRDTSILERRDHIYRR
jgi:hypothetical protein